MKKNKENETEIVYYTSRLVEKIFIYKQSSRMRGKASVFPASHCLQETVSQLIVWAYTGLKVDRSNLKEPKERKLSTNDHTGHSFPTKMTKIQKLRFDRIWGPVPVSLKSAQPIRVQPKQKWNLSWAYSGSGHARAKFLSPQGINFRLGLWVPSINKNITNPKYGYLARPNDPGQPNAVGQRLGG